uniref:Uncharacterized protein n=1 Tax=Ascaris lumbricoides TaxID=6252 RepID=A0A0M3HNA1_ASCLU
MGLQLKIFEKKNARTLNCRPADTLYSVKGASGPLTRDSMCTSSDDIWQTSRPAKGCANECYGMKDYLFGGTDGIDSADCSHRPPRRQHHH